MSFKKILALALALLMLTAILAGCQPSEPITSDEPGTETSDPGTDAPVATEDPDAYKYGGTYIRPMGGDPGTLLYWLMTQNGNLLGTILNDVLFYLDIDTDEITYRVCEGMDISEDGTVYTLNLRDNVYWHDGTKLTAEDVVWSHDIWYDEGWFFPLSWTIPGDWQALDEKTVQITLEEPDSTLIYSIARYLQLQPKHYYEGLAYDEYMSSTQALNPIGCGPFKFDEYVVGDYMHFVANEDFWNGKPYLNDIIMKIGAGSGSEGEINFETGQIDSMNIDKSYYREIEDRTDEFQFVINDKPTSNFGLDLVPFMQEGYSFLSNIELRRAMTYMIDYDSIINQLFYGYATRNNSIYGTGVGAYADVVDYTFDPDEAMRILDEAGFVDTDGNGIRNWPEEIGGNGLDLAVQFWYAGAGTESEYICIVLADGFNACGIAAVPYLINAGTFLDTYLAQWEKDGDGIDQAVVDALATGSLLFPMGADQGPFASEWKYTTDPELIYSTWREYCTPEVWVEGGYDQFGYEYEGDEGIFGYLMGEYGETNGKLLVDLVNVNRELRKETDPEKIKELYVKVQEYYCRDLVGYIPICGAWDIYGFSNRMHLEELDIDLRMTALAWNLEKLWVE